MKLLTLKKGLLLSMLSLSIFLSGCASFGRGVVEAMLEKDLEDTRICQVNGKPFTGIAASMAKPLGKTKILMVHGVGDKLPGYATQFLEKLARELKVSAKANVYKDIQLVSPLDTKKNLGNLRINRFQNADGSKELLFYELTWSEITRAEKTLLGFDNSGEYSFKRAGVNDLLKKFSNDTGPDPIIYLGISQVPILRSFTQALCWMGKDDWEQIPTDSRVACKTTESFSKQTSQDNFVFIAHSLGSRITIDGLQRLASIFEDPKKYSTASYDVTPPVGMKQLLQKKKIQIFMLSNQLPILQLGRELPDVTEQKAAYCNPNGAKYSSRLFSETSLVAFSDPNDLLSYAIPHHFSEKYLDSRLCINVTNININVSKVIDTFGLGDFANPLDAHLGYSTDDRIIAMIANGIGNDHISSLIKEKCEWTEIID